MLNKRIIFSFLLCIAGLVSHAQIASIKVLTTSGRFDTSKGYMLTATVGEPVTAMFESDSVLLTQGFQQVFPNMTPITGLLNICVGASTTLSDTGSGVWRSSNTSIATVGLTNGIVTGVSAGIAIIVYNKGWGVATMTITVSPLPSPIAGSQNVCVGNVTVLTDVGSGTWSSVNLTVGTVSSAGVVSGIAAGTTTISFTSPSSCRAATTIVTVNPLPDAGTIAGVPVVCAGGSMTALTDIAVGGAWSSTAISSATVGSAGVVTGVLSGTSTISYTVTNGCGTAAATQIVTVNPLPYAGTVVGTATVCPTASVSLSDAASGGVWSSTATGTATVGSNGIVAGVAAGTTTISYAVTNSCGTAAATQVVTVNPSIDGGTISGIATVCSLFSTQLSDNGTGGGSWSSALPGVATVGTSGLVPGGSFGTAMISYNVSNSCGAASANIVVTVGVAPSAGVISGTLVECVAASTALTDGASGGTWSSVSPGVATVGTSGLVTGVSAGSSVISYFVTNSCGSDVATAIVTVNPLPDAGAITGTAIVCAGGGMTPLTDISGGGVWSSTDIGIATVGSTGIVSGVAPGTATLSYSVTNGCGLAAATDIVTVDPLPDAGTITGAAAVCEGSATTQLTDVVAGGTWSSTATVIAAVGSSGIVTGIAAGTTTISYAVGTSCGVAVTTLVVTVNPLPNAGIITGVAVVCEGGAVTNLSDDAMSGGTWSSTAPVFAAVGSTGIVTGLATGTSTISYTVNNGCGSAAATQVVTVNPLPDAGVITGGASVCEGGGATVLSDAASGGVWSSTAPGFATVSSTGTVTGVATGTSTISYSVSNGCGNAGVSLVVTVNPLPDAGVITGAGTVCVSSNTSLSDVAAGGAWTSGAIGFATIGTTGVVAGVAAGTATLSYTVTNGCGVAAATTVVSVNPLPNAGAITGLAVVCAGGATTSLSDLSAGGGWSSAATGVAIVGSTGVVTSIVAGTSTISYSVTNICGAVAATRIITINPLPDAGVISGTFSVCPTAAISLTDPGAIGVGVWSSATTSVATIGSTGVVTGVAMGTSTISYSVTNSCGNATTSQVVTVDPLPDAGVITGGAEVCAGGATTLLSDAASGGTWSGGASGVANVGSTGLVTGLSGGTANVTYTFTNSCGGAFATKIVTVDPLPTVIAISGANNVCQLSTILLSEGTSGGTWSSSSSSIATIGPSGIVTGLSMGSTTISYSVSNGCGTTTVTSIVTVNPLPSLISGISVVSYGFTVTLSDVTGGGIWTSSNGNATIGSSSGIITGGSPGTSVITYSLSTGCYTTLVVTVDPTPPVSGTMSVCVGGETPLSNAETGGTWSTTSANASVDGSGNVTGLMSGTAVITYSFPVGGFVTAVVSINALPASVSGPGDVCVGLSITLTDATSGGNWSSSYSAAVGSASGVVTGLTPGTAVITYTLFTGCAAYRVVTINAVTVPSVSVSNAPSGVICSGTSVLFTAMGSSGGAAPAYQWNVNGALIAGATNTTYGYVPVNGDVVKVQLISSALCAIPATVTGTDTMSVIHTDTSSVTISVSPGDTVCAGAGAIFTASGVNGGLLPVYIWSRNSMVVSTGSTYSLVPAAGDIVYCRLVSSLLCKVSDTVSSNHVIMTVDTFSQMPAVSVIASPGTIIHPFETDTFTAVITNGAPVSSYQWTVNSTIIPGATSAIFVRSGFSNHDSVSCRVTGVGSCAYASFNDVILHVVQVGLAEVSTGAGQVLLKPNPNNGQFTIEGSLTVEADQEFFVQITDILGREVFRRDGVTNNGLVNEKIQLDPNLADGVYLLNLISGADRKVFHFVVQK